jgi:nicotinate phosphoribosyltransferase
VADLARQGLRVDAVRLDSGDLAALSREVRAVLDAGGCSGTRIVASGNLDEFEIAALLAAGAPIDTFGVGTRLDVSVDAPCLDCVYKLEEYGGRPRRKRSAGKSTWPGRKQVFRTLDARGRVSGDVVGLHDEGLAGRALLQPVMRAGRLLHSPTIDEVRSHARREIDALPDACRAVSQPVPLEPEFSPGLRALTERVDREFP